MKITHAVTIAAPTDLVWRVTRDVESWPDWTPTVTSVRILGERPLQLGSVATIKQPLQPPAAWTVIEFDEGRRFAWMTERRGMRLTGVHDIRAGGAGTENRLELHAAGPLAVVLWPVLRLAIRMSLAAENAGLKSRCEQLAARST